MRVKDLLRMSSGQAAEDINKFPFGTDQDLAKVFLAMPVPFKPGTHFVYNTEATYMLSAIVQKVTGQTVLDYLGPRLFEPLGIRNPTWEASAQGISLGGFGLSIHTEDIARFGQLYLQKGKLAGQAAGAGVVGRGSHLAPDLKREQSGQRLGPRLRLPVLALSARVLPGRRGVRPALHRDAGI
jgi:CubicO group peptidase (beta-lactamase class C family)